ncbi:cytochrome b561 and DOMON domain-containing protein At3g61750-like [Cucurbita pepo subsp. pepo]|uniref:cytochrome b561 and DOMON domain-containing protein At3g61750-like n=1 Tax=Cucurbita pepo subsp. pepo TaxID=3664 RepID=UPI000C9D9497|nr:cytochrome b561 and DOMON domain-containing protein At3g61750-like [Cucurbita pepo subsp. pepo]
MAGSISKFSKKLLPSLFCLVVVGFTPEASDVQSPSCSSNLREILPTPYSDLSGLACSLIWQQTFSFHFYQDDQNVTTLVLAGRHAYRWIGIGFSGDGKMVGSSAIVAWIERDGVSGLRQYYLEGKNMSRVIPDKGDLHFTTASPAVVVHGELLYIAFQLKFSSSLSHQPILIAIGSGNPLRNGLLPKHVNSTTTHIEFSTGRVARQPMNPSDLRRYHGMAAVIGWGILTPAGLLIARYFRHVEPSWYYFHSSTQFIGFFIGIISISLGRNLYQRTNATFLGHKFLGYTVFFLAGLEVCQFMGRPSRESIRRQYWNFVHYWVGRTAMVLGVSNVFVGFHGVNADKGLKICFFVAFVTLLIALIFFEGRMRRKNEIPKAIIDQPPVFRIAGQS